MPMLQCSIFFAQNGEINMMLCFFFLNMIYDKCICFNDDNMLNMIPLITFPHIKHFPETMVDDGGCRG